MSADPRVHLSQVLDLAESVIEGARPDQATLPTPCRSWDVQTLVAHLITDTERSAVAASGGTPDWTAPVPEVEGDWASAFHAGAAELKAAWQHAGDMNEELDLRIGRVHVPLWSDSRSPSSPYIPGISPRQPGSGWCSRPRRARRPSSGRGPRCARSSGATKPAGWRSGRRSRYLTMRQPRTGSRRSSAAILGPARARALGRNLWRPRTWQPARQWPLVHRNVAVHAFPVFGEHGSEHVRRPLAVR